MQDHVDQPTLVLVMKKGSEAEVQIILSLQVSEHERVPVQMPEEAEWNLCLERGAYYGARSASGLVIFR